MYSSHTWVAIAAVRIAHPLYLCVDGRLRFILAVAGTASLSSMLDALGKDAKLLKMVELLDPTARAAAVKALTDKINNLPDNLAGARPSSPRATQIKHVH